MLPCSMFSSSIKKNKKYCLLCYIPNDITQLYCSTLTAILKNQPFAIRQDNSKL